MTVAANTHWVDRLLAIPAWVRWTALGLVLVLVAAGLTLASYNALDPLYPQELWRYFRPEAPAASGSVLFRDPDGKLFLAPASDISLSRRLSDPTLPAGTREVIRDAVALPDGKHVAYFATDTAPGQAESDFLKVLSLDGQLARRIPVAMAAGEPIRPTVYTSTSGRYLAVTNRERTRVHYYDVSSGGPLVAGAMAEPPEPMLWNRNGDLRVPVQAGQPAFASTTDGRHRAQVREGRRRAPECGDEKCEAVQELVVLSGTVAGSARPPTVIYGVFSSFSAEGWGPIPAQPAQRLYGRLVWSPDGSQILFSALDGEEVRSFAINADGKTRPRLIVPVGEALDWIP